MELILKRGIVRIQYTVNDNMHKLIYFLLVIGVAVSSPSTPVKKCKGVTGELFKRVVVSTPKGVCTKLPCNLISGADVKADITFHVKNEVEKITLKCNATALGTTIQYPIPNADKGCDMLTNTNCPVEPDTEADLTFKMHVSKIFPKVNVDLVMYLLDQKHNMIACFEVPTRVVEDKNLANTQ